MTEKENAIVPIEEHSIMPAQLVEFASDAAKHLKDIVTKTHSSIMLGKSEHLKFEAWQTIAKFYGSTVTVDWTKPILMQNEGHLEEVFGYEAKASVLDKDGKILSSAESGCFKDEDNWRNKPSFQLRSMAQTRACAKALRNVYAWVVVLAGYTPTPAEEMDGITPQEKSVQGFVSPKPTPMGSSKANDTEMVCQKCKDELSEKVFNYSMQKFGKPFCYNCQEKIKEELAKIPNIPGMTTLPGKKVPEGAI